MKLPSFEQFLADMGPDFLTNANARALGEDFTLNKYADLVSASTLIAVEILADYHAWLQRQLADS